jgi:hypothetical protein
VQRESGSGHGSKGDRQMYVRTWKDTDMVATSDSNPTGSTSNDESEAAPEAPASTAETTPESAPTPDSTSSTSSDVTEPAESSPAPAASPDSDAAASSSPAARPVAAPSVTAPTETARSRESSSEPARNRARRSGSGVSRDQVVGAVNGVRERLAAIVWIVAVVFAVILAAGALLIALEANPNNDLVERMVDWAGDLDGPFRNLFEFDGDNAAKKAALTNWGLAAAAWLVGGKILSSIIRP